MSAARDGSEPRPNRFTPAFRLRHRREFEAVYAARARAERGPLVVHARPNECGHPRLGLSIARRVGSAPRRNRLKRKLRDVFRTTRSTWPGAYDVVVSARPHDDVGIEAYRRWLADALDHLHATWTKRRQRARANEASLLDPPTAGSPSPPAF